MFMATTLVWQSNRMLLMPSHYALAYKMSGEIFIGRTEKEYLDKLKEEGWMPFDKFKMISHPNYYEKNHPVNTFNAIEEKPFVKQDVKQDVIVDDIIEETEEQAQERSQVLKALDKEIDRVGSEPITIYRCNGRSKVIKISEYQEWHDCGWRDSLDEAKKARKPRTDRHISE